MAFELMQLFAEIRRRDVPDDDGCVCASGQQDGTAFESGGQETFDKVGVALESLNFAALLADGVDILVPGAGVDGIVGANGETCQRGSPLVEDFVNLARLRKNKTISFVIMNKSWADGLSPTSTAMRFTSPAASAAYTPPPDRSSHTARIFEGSLMG